MNKSVKEKLYDLILDHDHQIEYDLFSYGFDIICDYSIFIIIIFPFSCILNILFEEFVLILLFIPIRRYLGGFHFKSHWLCLFFSTLLALLIPCLAIISGKIPFFSRLIICTGLILITYGIQAVDHPNKRIMHNEKAYYTKIALLVELSYSIPIVFLYFSPFYRFLNIALLLMGFIVSGLVIAFFANKAIKNKN